MTILKREDLVPRIDFFQNSGIWTGSIEFPDCRPLEDVYKRQVQVVNNLVTNAVDAEKGMGGGVISILLEKTGEEFLIKVKDTCLLYTSRCV